MIREWVHKQRIKGLSVRNWRWAVGLYAAMGIAMLALHRFNVSFIDLAAGACIGGAAICSIGLSYAIVIEKARKLYGDDFLKDF